MVQVHLNGERQYGYTYAMDSGTACTEPGQRLGEHGPKPRLVKAALLGLSITSPGLKGRLQRAKI